MAIKRHERCELLLNVIPALVSEILIPELKRTSIVWKNRVTISMCCREPCESCYDLTIMTSHSRLFAGSYVCLSQAMCHKVMSYVTLRMHMCIHDSQHRVLSSEMREACELSCI